MNYYQFHIGDYAAHTQRLSLMEDLAYRRIIDAYYLNERPFNGCSTDVAREIGMRDHVEAVEYVLTKFFQLDDQNSWHHTRCDKEIALYQEKKEQTSKAGKASAQRALNVRSTDVGRTLDGGSTDVQLTKNHEPITNNQEPLNTEPTVLVVTPLAQRLLASPNQEIVDRFHQYLPALPRVEVLNDSRKRVIAARWREVCNDPEIKRAAEPRQAALDWFSWYFDYASKSKFLTGRTKDWRADFDFLMTPSKFTKTVEGHYHKDAA